MPEFFPQSYPQGGDAVRLRRIKDLRDAVARWLAVRLATEVRSVRNPAHGPVFRGVCHGWTTDCVVVQATRENPCFVREGLQLSPFSEERSFATHPRAAQGYHRMVHSLSA